ncbi:MULTISPECIES: hypothetical protein [Streptomycetaceae]|uniref:DUF1963 domain-containing protein n=1 Tax=Streptantibioticus cattleyicolor (strain ATCC 35852 / DSM 46488 / JCM 4925 / NBRC 14057 / NRRL 8057) TaxID=1003195 RepID=F8K2Y0_STREN|nr:MULTISPECIES: hypothetical protein [Streptomycetaceae]AEW92466.1 hypothetical protein SCATT_00950 [Streptantibioticus cattleyicolor NRRL 8057 = DSM 46488]MYS57272.1 hypothetical protein [Streptomyces sp. SID5468]CCB72829.1 conserved protein of unknown function [Streptantibioticus cattleyicolor NRRL 8057 = DSM 46488]
MSRTTPPRPVDVSAVLPQLAPLARTATRLHPRPGSPSPYDSSVGGPLLWPAAEPWPYCEGPHEPDGVNPAVSPADVRRRRRIQAAAAGQPGLGPEELVSDEQLRTDRPWPDGPVAMLPVAQLYVRDVPLPVVPEGADLLQVLWCPFDHLPEPRPRTALFWRSAATVTEVLTAPPQSAAVQSEDYVPEPCLLDPEQVTEYPHPMELSTQLRARLDDWATWQSAGAAPDSSYELAPGEFYLDELSLAPGWKTGGWSRWGLTDPVPRLCAVCDAELTPLLTIASDEWDASTGSWIPYEDQAAAASTAPAHSLAHRPTMITVGSGYSLQIHVCPVSSDHPHKELIQ